MPDAVQQKTQKPQNMQENQQMADRMLATLKDELKHYTNALEKNTQEAQSAKSMLTEINEALENVKNWKSPEQVMAVTFIEGVISEDAKIQLHDDTSQKGGEAEFFVVYLKDGTSPRTLKMSAHKYYAGKRQLRFLEYLPDEDGRMQEQTQIVLEPDANTEK